MITFIALFSIVLCFAHGALPKNDQPTFHVFSVDRTFYFVDPNFEGNFFSAIEFCEKNGMEAVAIESPTQNQAIYHELLKLIGDKQMAFWSSGSRLSSNGAGDWIWMSTGNKIGMGHWGTGEPNTSGVGARQQCLQLRFYKGYVNGYWDDVECSTVLPVVCQSVDY